MHSSGSELPTLLGRGTLTALSPASISRRHCSDRDVRASKEFREHELSELTATPPPKSTRETRSIDQPSTVLSEVFSAFFGLRTRLDFCASFHC